MIVLAIILLAVLGGYLWLGICIGLITWSPQWNRRSYRLVIGWLPALLSDRALWWVQR